MGLFKIKTIYKGKSTRNGKTINADGYSSQGEINQASSTSQQGPSVSMSDISDLREEFKEHTHKISDVDDLQETLDGKASTSHTHTSSDITDLSTSIDNKINELDVSDSAVTGKLVASVSETDGKISVTKKGLEFCNEATDNFQDNTQIVSSVASGYSSSNPNFIRRKTSYLWNYIKGKADSVYAAISHTHAISDVTSLQTTLDGKASASHTHTSSDVTDLSTSIDNKINALDVSDSAVTGKLVASVSETDGKISVTKKGLEFCNEATDNFQDNTQIVSSVASGYSSSNPNFIRRKASYLWNYIKSKADSVYAAISHTHTSSDVTDLSSTIDNKINALDVSDTATNGKVVTSVSETNGKITVTRKGYDAYVKATADVKDATEIITTENTGPTSQQPLIYRRPATALWNYINGKADTIYLKTANFESQLTGTARRYFAVFNNSTTSSLQYVKIFEAQLPNDGKERGGFIDSYMFEYSNSTSNVIKTCRISYIIGRNSGSNTVYSMITKSMSSYEDYILAYSTTDSKYAIYANLKAVNRRNVFEVHQAYDEQNITYVQRPDPVASLPSGYTYRYAVPFNHVTQSLDLIGSNVAGVIYGKVCSYEFTNMTKGEARCVTLRINSRTIVHNVVVRAGSDGIELYDNVYGISSADRGLYGYLETVDSSWYRVTIYMMMNNYREGASITDVSFPAFNIRYNNSREVRNFTTYHNQYVTTLPTGYVTATVNAAAMYDEDYNVIKSTYKKKVQVYKITNSSTWNTYARVVATVQGSPFNASYYVLTAPNGDEDCMFYIGYTPSGNSYSCVGIESKGSDFSEGAECTIICSDHASIQGGNHSASGGPYGNFAAAQYGYAGAVSGRHVRAVYYDSKWWLESY